MANLEQDTNVGTTQGGGEAIESEHEDVTEPAAEAGPPETTEEEARPARGRRAPTRGESGSMTVKEAGRKGGAKVAKQRGREFYEEIGRKGGEKVAAERGHDFYAAIGRKGGEKVASERGHEFYEEIGRKGGEKVASERGSEFYSTIGHQGGQRVKELIAKGKAKED
jgi:general stress protein YciG